MNIAYAKILVHVRDHKQHFYDNYWTLSLEAPLEYRQDQMSLINQDLLWPF